MTPTTLYDGFAFIEGPRWHDGALWFSDMHDDSVWRAAPGKAPEKMADVPGYPSGLGWLPDGRLLVVSMMDKHVLRQEASGALVPFADLRHGRSAGPGRPRGHRAGPHGDKGGRRPALPERHGDHAGWQDAHRG